MDSTVGYYAGGWPAALARSLFDRGVDLRRLLFVAREGDPRFALGSYQLTTSFTTTADLGDRYRKIQLPAEAFDPLESYGRVGLHQPVLPLEIALNHQDLGSSADWSVYYESVHGGIQLTDWDSNHPGDSALLQIRSPSKATFVLHSKRRVAPPGHGLLLLIYTKSASTGGYASLYEVEAHGQGSPQALQMVKPLSQTIELDGGAESRRRFGVIYLIPVRPDREYGVYIYGQGEETQFIGGWAVYYQPFPDG